MTTAGYLPPWAVSDDDALDMLPKSGFIKEYVETVKDWTDCPIIYHVGSCLTYLGCLLGKCTLEVDLGKGRNYRIPIRSWACIIGDSGDRKSHAMHIGKTCMMRSQSDLFIPTDGSLEAWHDTVAEDLNPNILLYDELASLFDFSKRSYTIGAVSWMLSMWEGVDYIRTTKGKGRVTAYNPRLSVLGGIPPDTLASKTKKSDWRSGFLARWAFFPGRRTNYQRTPYEDKHKVDDSNRWCDHVPWRSHGVLSVHHLVSDRVHDWAYEHVELKREQVSSELFSALNRLQDLALMYAAMIEVSKQVTPVEQHLAVTQSSVDEAIKVIHILYTGLLGLFHTVSSNEDNREETDILEAIGQLGGSATITSIMEKTGLSRKRVRHALLLLHKDGEIIEESLKTPGRGRPFKLYRVT